MLMRLRMLLHVEGRLGGFDEVDAPSSTGPVFTYTEDGYEKKPPRGPEGTLLCVEGQRGGFDEVDASVYVKTRGCQRLCGP